MSEEKIFEIQCDYCSHINKFIIKGEYLYFVAGDKIFISHEHSKNRVCEKCGSEIYG